MFLYAMATSDVVTALVVCVLINDTATTEIYKYGYTSSQHDALPIYPGRDEPCKSLRLVEPRALRPERVPADVRQRQRVRVDEHDPAYTRFGERKGHRPTHRAAAQHHHGRGTQRGEARILPPAVDPGRVHTVHR